MFKKKTTEGYLTSEEAEQKRLIQMAIDAGIELPKPQKICNTCDNQGHRCTMGTNYTVVSRKRKAEIAKRELQKRGLI